MKTADCYARIEETYPLRPIEEEAPHTAILRESVITAARLHLVLKTVDDNVTSAQIQNLIDAVQDIFTLTLCRIPEIYESYGTIIRPLDLLKEQIQYSEPTPKATATIHYIHGNEPLRSNPAESQVQSIYVEPADPVGYHSNAPAGINFGDVLAAPGEADRHESA